MVLDLAQGTWERLRPRGVPPSPRDAAASVVIGDVIYYHGGMNGARLADLYSLNTQTHVWDKIVVQGVNSGRSHHSAVALDSKIILFGGWVDSKAEGSDAAPEKRLWSTSDDLIAIDCGEKLADFLPSLPHIEMLKICFCLQRTPFRRRQLSRVNYPHRERGMQL